MKRAALVLLAILALVGCAALPFRETGWDEGTPSPRSVIDRFRAGLAERFHLLNAIVFEYNSRSFAVLGAVEVDRSTGRFRAACMNSLGVKFFALSGDERSIVNEFTLEPLSRYGDIAAAAGTDIRRIYFGLLPAADARVWAGKDKVRFRQSEGNGTLELIYSIAGDLVEKNFYGSDGLEWRISYRDHQDLQGKRFPREIRFLNYQYSYRLIVRQKELLREEDQGGR